MKDKKNLQSNYHFIQKLSFYFSQKTSFISSTNGLNCNATDPKEIIKLIINKDKQINYDLLFKDIFLNNKKIDKYIDYYKLSKISYHDNLEAIQILLRILSQKRIKKLLINDFKLIRSLNRYISEFKNIFTKIKKVDLITKKYPKFLKDSSSQVFKIEYDNGDIFYFKNIKKKIKNEILIDSTIKNSELRPCHLNLSDTYNKQQLYRLLRFKLRKLSNQKISEILLIILESIIKLDKISDKIYIPELNDKLKEISIEDQRCIFKDFGEIISAFNYCQDDKISFTTYNEKVVDFIIHKENKKELYSCKYTRNNSSKSSLSYILDYMKTLQLDDEEKKLYDLLSIVVESKGSLNSFNNLSNFLNIKESSDIEFFNLPIKDQRNGRLIYIYSRNCKKILNNSFYKNLLNRILNKLDINQITINYDKNNFISFDNNHFSESSFIFESSVSVNKYNSKLSFKME